MAGVAVHVDESGDCSRLRRVQAGLAEPAAATVVTSRPRRTVTAR